MPVMTPMPALRRMPDMTVMRAMPRIARPTCTGMILVNAEIDPCTPAVDPG